MTTTRKFPIIIAKTSDGFNAYSEEGAFTVASTMKRLEENILEMMNLHLADENITVTAADLDLRYDLPSFFAHYPAINAKGIADIAGLNNTLLSQYVNGAKKPGKKQMLKILDGIHKLASDLANVKLSF